MSLEISNNPFLPKRVHYVTQAGLFVGSSATRHLTEFLGQHGSVTPIVNPNISFGRKMENAKIWFSAKVDQIRIELTKLKLSYFLQSLKGTVQSKEQWIREYFSLKEGDDLSKVVVRHVMNLFDKNVSDFLSLIQKLKKSKGTQLAQIVIDQINKLKDELQESNLTSNPIQDQKIVNGVYDLLTPRVAVLGGHSMGGLTALQSMQAGNNDISMVLGFGAPINGADPKKIPARWLLSRVFPIVRELMTGSDVLKATYNMPVPCDSTMFAIDLKDRKDTVILPNQLNPEFTNAHHIEVEPKEADASDLLKGLLKPVGLILDHPPPFMKQRAEKNRYHLSYLDKRHIPLYFSEEKGSLLHEFAMSENAPENTCRLLSPNNYGALQAGFLQWLKDKINARELDYDLREIIPGLEHLKSIPLPFIHSEYDLACEVSELI